MVTVKQAYDKIRTNAIRLFGYTEYPYAYKYGQEARENFDKLVEIGATKYMSFVWAGDKTEDALRYACLTMKRAYEQMGA